jgi:hypothetical protein
MKIIQICGTNGVGKTTLVKGLLSSGNFLKLNQEVSGISREWWFDGKVAVVGKYNDRNCCGVDAGNYSGDELIKTIVAIIQRNRPETVLFEDVRFGGGFTFKQKLKKAADGVGYDYYLMALIASLECSCNRVLNRSGNIDADYDSMRSKARGVINSTKKAGTIGAKIVFCDTEKNDKAAVLNVLRRVIND